MEKRFSGLRFISLMLKILAVLELVLYVILTIWFVVNYIGPLSSAFNMMGGTSSAMSNPSVAILSQMQFLFWLVPVMMIIGACVNFATLWFYGDMANAVISIEENTRFTALLIRDRLFPQQPPR